MEQQIDFEQVISSTVPCDNEDEIIESEEGVFYDSGDYISDDEFDRKISPFSSPDLVIKIKRRKLYVKKELLMEESPVFERMFSGDFAEKDAKEIELPGKNVVSFVNFLRCTLPGIDEEFTDHTVHSVLPLAWEYQVERVLKKADSFLTRQCNEEGGRIRSNELIEKILEAELYNLNSYLKVCIEIASRKRFSKLVSCYNFKNVSKDTQLKITFKRCEDIENMFAETNFFNAAVKGSRYRTAATSRLAFEQVGERMKDFMINN